MNLSLFIFHIKNNSIILNNAFTISCNSPLGPTLSKFNTRVPTGTSGEALPQEPANHSIKEERDQ